eukprot:3694265-Ditylum_brightwellii.AAC.1
MDNYHSGNIACALHMMDIKRSTKDTILERGLDSGIATERGISLLQEYDFEIAKLPSTFTTVLNELMM